MARGYFRTFDPVQTQLQPRQATTTTQTTPTDPAPTSYAQPAVQPTTQTKPLEYEQPAAPPPPSPSTAAPAGWDQTKWDNPEHTTPKYVVGRLGTAFGDLRDEGNRNAFIAAVQQAYPGTTFNGKDTLTIPGAAEDGSDLHIDVFRGASVGEYGLQWIDKDIEARERAAQQAAAGGWLPPAPAAVPGAGGGGGGGFSTSSGSLSTSLAPNPNRAAYQARIAELLQTPLTVSADDLALTPEAQAAQLTRQRAEERMRGQLAERAEFEGYSGGAVDAELQGIRGDLAENEIRFMADLAMQKMAENREQLMAGISFAQADNNVELEAQLRRELANLDAAIQRESIAAGLQTSAADNALRRELGLLGIGYNYDALQAQMNQSATEAMLRGFR